MAQERELVSLGAYLNESNYALFAEKIMMKLRDEKLFGRDVSSYRGLTTTKIRGIYGQIMNIYTRINTPEDFETCKSDLQYLQVKMAYEAGREQAVKTFFDKTDLMKLIKFIQTYDQFKLYCRYAESLVAYFKFYGGKDK
jgi:CRISPR-associated protein Csm2